MCRQLILLAKNDYRQMIFTCEHGTMHITHQCTTLCFRRADFLRFAQWITEGNPFVLNPSSAWCIQESSDGLVELWVGSGGLRLTVMEFFAFTSLLREALTRLQTIGLEQLRQIAHSSATRLKPSLN